MKIVTRTCYVPHTSFNNPANIRLPNREPETTPIPYSKRAWIDTYLDEPWYSNGHILLKGEPRRINTDIVIITGVIPHYLTRFTKDTPTQHKRPVKPLTEIAYPRTGLLISPNIT